MSIITVLARSIQLLIYASHTVPEYPTSKRTTAALLNILRMSHFFNAATARTFAVNALSDRNDVSTVMRLHWAHTFDILEWIEPAIKDMVYKPLSDFVDKELALLGEHALLLIWRTKERIALHRRACAVHIPPAVHVAECNDPFLRDYCDSNWRKTWWGEHDKEGVVHFLVRQEVPMRTILTGLKQTELMWMEKACLMATVAKLEVPVDEGGKLLLEEKLIYEAAIEFSRF